MTVALTLAHPWQALTRPNPGPSPGSSPGPGPGPSLTLAPPLALTRAPSLSCAQGMLQRGVNISSLDTSYITSMSWHVLVVSNPHLRPDTHPTLTPEDARPF